MRPAPRFATVEFVFEIEAGLYGANEAQKGGASTTARVTILGTPAYALRRGGLRPQDFTGASRREGRVPKQEPSE
jgi:hypothetical protein